MIFKFGENGNNKKSNIKTPVIFFSNQLENLYLSKRNNKLKLFYV